MIVFISIIFLTIWLYLRLSATSDSLLFRNKENRYCWVVCIVLIFVSAFRGETVGADTLGYMYDYRSMSEYSIRELLIRYKGYEGFYIVAWICNKMKFPLQLWLGMLSAIYVIPVGLLTKRYSKDRLFCMLCFITMGAFHFSLAGLKQTFAMGLLIMGFLLITNKKVFWGVLLSVWAYFSHRTSSCFFIIYPFFFFSKNKLSSQLWLTVICIMVLFFARSLLSGLLSYFNEDHFSSYLETEGTYSATTFIFYFFLFMISWLSNRHQRVMSKDGPDFLFYVSVVCVVVQTLAFVSASAFRISLFFLPFFGIYISNSLSDRSQKVIRYIVMFVIVFFFLYTERKSSYHFIWEGVHVADPLHQMT